MDNVVMRAKIISAFPACGKSYAHRNSKKKTKDSDSSLFRKQGFPKNYLEHIERLYGLDYDYLFVSSHKSVRDGMRGMGIPFTLFYPDRSLKHEYVERMKLRKSPESMILFISQNWGKFIDEIENDEQIEKVKMHAGQYLIDFI